MFKTTNAIVAAMSEYPIFDPMPIKIKELFAHTYFNHFCKMSRKEIDNLTLENIYFCKYIFHDDDSELKMFKVYFLNGQRFIYTSVGDHAQLEPKLRRNPVKDNEKDFFVSYIIDQMESTILKRSDGITSKLLRYEKIIRTIAENEYDHAAKKMVPATRPMYADDVSEYLKTANDWEPFAQKLNEF